MSVKTRSLSDSFDFGSIPNGALHGRHGAGWLELINQPGDGSSGSVSPPPPAAIPPVPMPPPLPLPSRLAHATTSSGAGGRRSPSSGRGRGRSETRAPDSRRVSPPVHDSPPRPTELSGNSLRTPSYGGGSGGAPGRRVGPVDRTSPLATLGHDQTPSSHYAADLATFGSPIPVEEEDSDPASWALVTHLQRRSGGGSGSRGAEARTDGYGRQHEAHDDSGEAGDGVRGSYARLLDAGEEGSSPPLAPRSGEDVPRPFPYGHDTSVVTARPAPSSGYTSALIQALSAVEGAAVANTSQQSFSSVPLYSSGTRGREGRAGAEVVGDRGLDLYNHAMRVKVAKQQWVSLEKARQELLEEARLARDCPFRPQLSAYAEGISRPAQLRPERRARGEVLRRRQWAAMKRREAAEREMEACTFRPLTVRAARAGGGVAKEASRAGSEVFRELYQDAEARQYFTTHVQPQVVDVMERYVTRQGPSVPVLPEEEVRRVVERLCAKGAVVAHSGAEAGEGAATFRPELSPQTRRMVAEKVRRGERDPDVVNDLYGRRDAAALDRQLEVALRETEERHARQSALAEREATRTELDLERFRVVLAAKYRALARHAWAQQPHERQVFRAKGPHSVVDLARASLDVLSPDESEAILIAFEGCGVTRVTEEEFVFVVMHHVVGGSAGSHGAERVMTGEGSVTIPAVAARPPCAWRQSPLFLQPPPPERTPSQAPPQRNVSRSRSRGGALTAGGDPLRRTPPPLPATTREPADAAVIERARRRREERMLAWRAESRRRAELAELGDPADRPPPRRLIPFECRPDVHVPTRMNRAAALRRAHNVGGPSTVTAGAETIAGPTARSLFPTSAPHVDPNQGLSASMPVSSRATGPARASPSLLARRETSPAPAPASVPTPTPARVSVSPRRAALPAPLEPQSLLRGASQRAPSRSGSATTRRSVFPPGMSSTGLRGTIPEYAAFGGEDALMELGRELMLRQLQEYQAKRAMRGQ